MPAISAATAPIEGPARLARVAVLTASSLLLAVVAHVLGGGTVPSSTGLGLLALVVTAAAMALTSVRLRLPLMLGALGGGQFLLHEALSVMTVPWTGTLTLRGQHGTMAMHADVSGSVADGHAMAAMHSSPRMVLFHAAATIATAWLLARGEATMWRAVARVVPPRPGRRPQPQAGWRALIAAYVAVPPFRARGASVARGPPRQVPSARRPAGWLRALPMAPGLS